MEKIDLRKALKHLYAPSAKKVEVVEVPRSTLLIDYTVMALEGLWWTETGEFDFNHKDDWQWTMMIMQPEHITMEMYQEALHKLKAKKGTPALAKLRFESFQEGLCIQMMHIGPYAEEPRTLEQNASLCTGAWLYASRETSRDLFRGSPTVQAGTVKDDFEASSTPVTASSVF